MKKLDKLPRDGNQLAKRIVDISTGEAADLPPKPAAKKKAGGAKKTPPARRKKSS